MNDEISVSRPRKNNNFDFLRFLFASLVVISHSYPLSGSNESNQWIYKITDGQITLASLGLNGFFIISGYFIFQSMSRSQNLQEFYLKRFLRLFPGLLVVLILTLVFTPFVYQSKLALLSNSQFYTYIPYNLSLYGFQSGIKGVFDNNYYHSINGSLWTIRYEFSLYVAVSILFYFRSHKKLVSVSLFAVFTLFYFTFVFFLKELGSAKIIGMLGNEILYLGTFFICGSLLASLQIEKIKYKTLLFIFLLVITLVSIYCNSYNLVEHVTYPILILFIGFKALPFFSTFGKIGDLSYGIYIYSFPIQQTLMYFFKCSLFELLFYSLVLSIFFGYISWHWIEKRALRFRINNQVNF